MNHTSTYRHSRFCDHFSRQLLCICLCLSMFVAMTLTPVSAETIITPDSTSIERSTLYIGLKKLISDTMVAATVLCPVIGGLAAVYCVIRRSLADEQDGKLWEKRIYKAIVCGVAGGLIAGIITLIASYF